MRILASLLILLLANTAFSKEKDEGWIFTPSIGVNRLALDTFYDTVYKAPFVGSVEITTDLPEDVEGTNQYPTVPFFFKNDLSPNVVDIEASLVMRRNFSQNNDFFIGINAWETHSETVPIQITFPIQGEQYNEADYTRTGTLSYTQYFLGIRHYLTNRHKKFMSYFNLSLHEIYDVDYEEKHVFYFTSGAPEGFRRIFVFHSQATGILMVQFGAGAEYRFAERFSIGIEGAYSFHINDGFLRGVSVTDDTNDGDRIKSPPRVLNVINPSLDVGALEADGSGNRKVNLSFNGWHAMLKFNIDFY
ncbi:MAG: hypothetical protein R3240_03685 [Gammaproteobacteria bacterium]|nr:hypothetical protein [Gammaproteobacteria bacterium]